MLILIALPAKCLATHAETYPQATPRLIPEQSRADEDKGEGASKQPTSDSDSRREGGQLSFRRVCCSAPICHSLCERASATFASVVRSFAPKTQNCSNLPNLTPSDSTQAYPHASQTDACCGGMTMMRGRSERPDDVTLSAVLNEVHPSHSQSRFETMPRFDFDCCVSFQSLWVGVEHTLP